MTNYDTSKFENLNSKSLVPDFVDLYGNKPADVRIIPSHQSVKSEPLGSKNIVFLSPKILNFEDRDDFEFASVEGNKLDECSCNFSHPTVEEIEYTNMPLLEKLAVTYKSEDQ